MIDGCDSVASKVALWRLIKKKFGARANLIMPETFILSSKKDRKRFMEFFRKRKQENRNSKFILKNAKQRQQGLKLADKLSTVFNSIKDGFTLVQDFLENPYILSGRKVNLRYYLLITCHKGKIKGYLYDNGFVYYTPKLFRKYSMNFKETITTVYIDRIVYQQNPLTTQEFRDHLGPIRARKFDKSVNIKVRKVMKALSAKICSNKELDHHMKFQVFGADIAPDENLNVRIMEINKGPGLGFKDKRDGNLKKNMVINIFKVIEGERTSQFVRIY